MKHLELFAAWILAVLMLLTVVPALAEDDGQPAEEPETAETAPDEEPETAETTVR